MQAVGAYGRVKHIGQQRSVRVYRLAAAASVGERIVELHRDKPGMAEGVLAGDVAAQSLRTTGLLALRASCLPPKVADE